MPQVASVTKLETGARTMTNSYGTDARVAHFIATLTKVTALPRFAGLKFASVRAELSLTARHTIG